MLRCIFLSYYSFLFTTWFYFHLLLTFVFKQNMNFTFRLLTKIFYTMQKNLKISEFRRFKTILNDKSISIQKWSERMYPSCWIRKKYVYSQYLGGSATAFWHFIFNSIYILSILSWMYNHYSKWLFFLIEILKTFA